MEFNLLFSNICPYLYPPFAYYLVHCLSQLVFKKIKKILISRKRSRKLAGRLLRKSSRKKMTFSTYIKRLLKLTFKVLIKLRSRFIFSFFQFKKVLQKVYPIIFSFLPILLKIPNLIIFLYYFLTVYHAIFLLKMMTDFFPIQNWENSSPFKQFLRNITIDWTGEFDKYMSSFLSWIIVVNIIPILTSPLETVYRMHDLKTFLIKY